MIFNLITLVKSDKFFDKCVIYEYVEAEKVQALILSPYLLQNWEDMGDWVMRYGNEKEQLENYLKMLKNNMLNVVLFKPRSGWGRYYP